MRRCEDCKIILDDDVRYCPSCGKSVASDKRPVTSTSAEVGALLTSANLHRMRSEWDAAILDATEALKLDSDNPDIASLLGSIYEQRGMLSDAMIWYEMAVELNSSSDEDRARLDRVKNQMAEQRKNRTDSFGTFQRRTRIWAAVMGGVFLFIVIMALILAFGREKEQASTSIVREDAPSAVGIDAGVSSTNSPERERRTSALPNSNSIDLAGTSHGSAGLRTKPEIEIRSKVAEAQAVQESKVKVDDVIADPRNGVAIVTFSVPADGSVTRDKVLQAAGAIAGAAFDAHKQVQFVTARCIVGNSNADSAQVAFIGDIARSSLAGLSGTPTTQQLQSFFTNPYWNPSLQ